MNIKNMPLDDRPREKMLEKGTFALSNAELLAVLIRTGSKNCSALDIARSLIDTPEKLSALRNIKPIELARQKGIGLAKAVTIVAALELGRRLIVQAVKEKQDMTNTRDIVDFLMPQLAHETKELFLVIFLNAKRQFIGMERITQGTLTQMFVEPRDVFSCAIMNNAVGVIVAHNHPSGDCTPSDNDKEFTKRIVKAGEIMNIPLLEHIIIGDGIYYSFLEHDLI